MAIETHVALWTFVVDVEAVGVDVNPAGLLKLAALLDRHRIPASWTFTADPRSRALPLLLGRVPGADLLLQGDPTWLPPRAGRTHFASALEQRLAVLRKLGKHPSGVRLTAHELSEHLDLLVRHKLRWIVRDGGKLRGSTGGDLQLQHGRFGIWRATASWHWPQSGSWAAPFGGWADRQRLAKTVTSSRATVVSIDLAKMVQMPRQWPRLEELLRKVVRWRARGKLRVESLAGVTLVLRPPRRTPMRSILKPAA